MSLGGAVEWMNEHTDWWDSYYERRQDGDNARVGYCVDGVYGRVVATTLLEACQEARIEVEDIRGLERALGLLSNAD